MALWATPLGRSSSGSSCVRPNCDRFSRWPSGPESPDESRSQWRRAETRVDRLRHGRPRAAAFCRADGRTLPDSAFISYEHWISYQPDERFQIRVGRFLPAYGVRFADHTTYTRRYLDLDRNDQVYGLEVSHTTGPSLVQVMVSPGKAEAILHDRSRRGFSTAGRWQLDLSPRATIVGSGFYRHSTDVGPRSGAVGGAFGFAPTSRMSIWTEVDANLETKAVGGLSWVVVNEASVEVYRGIWLKFSPQLRTSGGAPGSHSPSLRLRSGSVTAHALERQHWVLPRSLVQCHDVDTSGAVAPVHVNAGRGHAPHRRGRQGDARLHRRRREAVIGFVGWRGVESRPGPPLAEPAHSGWSSLHNPAKSAGQPQLRAFTSTWATRLPSPSSNRPSGSLRSGCRLPKRPDLDGLRIDDHAERGDATPSSRGPDPAHRARDRSPDQ